MLQGAKYEGKSHSLLMTSTPAGGQETIFDDLSRDAPRSRPETLFACDNAGSASSQLPCSYQSFLSQPLHGTLVAVASLEAVGAQAAGKVKKPMRFGVDYLVDVADCFKNVSKSVETLEELGPFRCVVDNPVHIHHAHVPTPTAAPMQSTWWCSFIMNSSQGKDVCHPMRQQMRPAV